MMQPGDQLTEILPHLNALVDGIDPAQLDHSTPCSEFDVADVLEHMLTLGGAFAAWFRGEQPSVEVDAPTPGSVPRASFRSTMDDLLAAVQSPGAMERIIDTPMGSMPGDSFARLVALDGLLHGWDLARATGQAFEVRDAVVGAVDRFARSAITDEMRTGGMFALPQPEPTDGSRLDALAAFSGRTPPTHRT